MGTPLNVSEVGASDGVVDDAESTQDAVISLAASIRAMSRCDAENKPTLATARIDDLGHWHVYRELQRQDAIGDTEVSCGERGKRHALDTSHEMDSSASLLREQTMC